MTVTVGTNSYITEAELTTYATDRGITIATADKTTLIAKSMDYMEIQLYKGYKTVSTQALQFPRVLCADYYTQYPQSYTLCGYDSATVPTEIKTAQIVAALLIDLGEDLNPTLGKTIIREKIDVIEIEYRDNSTETKSFTQLNALLAPFLTASGGLKLVRV